MVKKNLNLHIMIISTFLLFTMILVGSATADSYIDVPENNQEIYAVTDTETIKYMKDEDPYEGVNRKIFAFNNALDKGLVEPVAKVYRAIVPSVIRLSARNFLSNLETPIVLLNDLLQGKLDRAEITFKRFLINSTIGFFGIGDPATDMGLVNHSEDFAQTMALSGIPSGPYIVSPIFGPSTPRHLVGRVVDYATHPLTWYLADQPSDVRLSYGLTETLIIREELIDILDETEATSTDYYAAIRSFYRQRRVSEINDGIAIDSSGEYSIDRGSDLNIIF
ncbi:VacJ family lipoprotein [Hyphomicrobiales bacterium]|jgi:phospholipid-binding lipoprotein MlaA|nr:VacJ family lipoprotein [Rhodobiaceae bacterium]MBT6222587.1 VacJ family lipoprotein [Rhodobiaceae bacterium]MDC0139221.1 VacJ family lipoprotein [Hyphomicrobiales bacterium]